CPIALVDFGPAHPLAQRLVAHAALLRDRENRRPFARVLLAMLEHQTHCSLAHLQRIPLAVSHWPILSLDRASKISGAVQCGLDSELVFAAVNGAPLSPRNLRSRVLKPAAKRAGLDWVGFHTFRHTCASMLFAEGRNAVQVQHW